MDTHLKELSISIRNFPKGLYFIKVNLNHRDTWTGKLVKE